MNHKLLHRECKILEYEDTRAVRKISSHFEYLEKRSSGLGVTWHSVRGDLSVHPSTATLPWS